MTTSAIVVPRSGSSRMRTQKRPDERGRSAGQSSCSDPRRPPVREVGGGPDASASFASSDGWNDAGPEHEPAVRAVDRRGETSTAAQRTSVPRTSAGASSRRRRKSRRETPSRSARPTKRVDPLPLQVVARVAVADGRGRRRGAVDHDEPERDEPERDEDEHLCLDALHPVTFDPAGARPRQRPSQPSACTSSRNWSPRCSKFSYWS